MKVRKGSSIPLRSCSACHKNCCSTEASIGAMQIVLVSCLSDVNTLEIDVDLVSPVVPPTACLLSNLIMGNTTAVSK